MTARLICGDVREMLATMEPESVQCCVTSPPYFGLRDYGVDGQIGLEPTPQAFVAALVDVFKEVRRVLRPDGTVWLNLGDSYFGTGKGPTPPTGFHGANGTPYPAKGLYVHETLKPKDLIGIPWRVAFALQEDGWWLRSDIIWAKPNPMPESVTDRPTKSHEYIFLLTKQERYYYDADAIREPYLMSSWTAKADAEKRSVRGANGIRVEGQKANDLPGNHEFRNAYHPNGRNKRSVWTVATQPYSEAHFATFPTALIEPCILAASREGDTVLDPFAGSGTTGVVALRHGRSFVGVELNPEYVQLARRRIHGDAPLFNRVEVA